MVSSSSEDRASKMSIVRRRSVTRMLAVAPGRPIGGGQVWFTSNNAARVSEVPGSCERVSICRERFGPLLAFGPRWLLWNGTPRGHVQELEFTFGILQLLWNGAPRRRGSAPQPRAKSPCASVPSPRVRGSAPTPLGLFGCQQRSHFRIVRRSGEVRGGRIGLREVRRERSALCVERVRTFRRDERGVEGRSPSGAERRPKAAERAANVIGSPKAAKSATNANWGYLLDNYDDPGHVGVNTAAIGERPYCAEGLAVLDGGLHRAGVPVFAGDVVLFAAVVAPDDRLAWVDADRAGHVAEIDDADEGSAIR